MRNQGDEPRAKDLFIEAITDRLHLLDCAVDDRWKQMRLESLIARFLCSQLLPKHVLENLLMVPIASAPLWSAGWTGSMTHTRGKHQSRALVVFSSQLTHKALGVDLEQFHRFESCSHRLALRIATQGECLETIRFLNMHHPAREGHSSALLDQAVAILFSCKESIYKCLQPSIGGTIGFHEVVITPVRWIEPSHAVRARVLEFRAFARPNLARRLIKVADVLPNVWSTGVSVFARLSGGNDIISLAGVGREVSCLPEVLSLV